MLTPLRAQLQKLIERSLAECGVHAASRPPVTLEIPNDKKHGEFSCTVALRLAAIMKRDPFSIAEELRACIETQLTKSPLKEKIAAIDVKRPGFINFFLADTAFHDILREVINHSERYGSSNAGANQKVQIEFVSANPTGPLSVAHARQAAVGDALTNILRFAGHSVTKEYYINDEGNQIELLGKSIECRAWEYFGRPTTLPAEGYQGEYIKDIAKAFIDTYQITDAESFSTIVKNNPGGLAHFGVTYLLDVIKRDLIDFGVTFDVWSSQSAIATAECIAQVLGHLQKEHFVYEKDGALWFQSTAFGDDKDRVVRKSDGSYTYLAPDIVYHQDKYERGFTKIINIWGPDHHGYIPRLTAAIQALGHHRDSLRVRIAQLATLYRDKQPLSMSTRRGQYISLREVIDEVGTDAARFFFLMRRLEAHLDFDLELAKQQTPENPVYYIQYAHARIHSIYAFAQESKLKPQKSTFDLLTEPEEISLIKTIGNFPDIIAVCEQQLDPFALVTYLLELATAFHKFYDCHRVIGCGAQLSSQRLGLVDATRIVLANGLRLLGVSAPESM